MEVSVIIPAYNEEKYIERTLKALPSTAEIIVVANGCTDNTVRLAKKYAKVIETKKRGVSMARNAGAMAASRNTLVFLDADIVVAEDSILKIVESKYDIGVCYAKPDVDKVLPKVLMSLKNSVLWMGFSSGLIFCTRECFEGVGGFKVGMDIGEDGLFLRSAKRMNNFGVVDTTVENSMRRFEKMGYFSMMCFWVKHFFRKSKKEYLAIR